MSIRLLRPFDEQAVVPYVLDLSGSSNHGLANRILTGNTFIAIGLWMKSAFTIEPCPAEK